MHHCLWEESYVLDSKSLFVALPLSLFYTKLLRNVILTNSAAIEMF
jgi:hypothetical protein